MSNLCPVHPHSRRVVTFINLPLVVLQMGSDILGPFPLVSGQLKFLIVAVVYFTKWVEDKVVPLITTGRVRHFY